MATHTSSIDDLLMGITGNSPTQETPDAKDDDISETESPAILEDDEKGAPESAQEGDSLDEEGDLEDEASSPDDTDDYGNPKASPRTYTEEEVNERINKAVRDRLSRFERNKEPTQAQARQAQEAGFEYDSASNESWEQQLEAFVEHTVSKMTQKQLAEQQRIQEMQLQAEFEAKFEQSMSKFHDFTEVVNTDNLTPAMVIATRAMNDPAAFLYAASKRNPQELQRIAGIKDPYKQMVEIGKLEERMRKTKSVSNAPKPVGRTKEDATISVKSNSKKEPTIDDLIAQSNAKRLQMMQGRRGR